MPSAIPVFFQKSAFPQKGYDSARQTHSPAQMRMAKFIGGANLAAQLNQSHHLFTI
jgi:hypothetical protein